MNSIGKSTYELMVSVMLYLGCQSPSWIATVESNLTYEEFSTGRLHKTSIFLAYLVAFSREF
jgi:hypothetical protein